MTEPLVSIKMITYNHASHIAKAIEGILQQKTNFPFELVIGEDCSIDGTREIVFEYQKKYPDLIRVITSETNVGMKSNSSRVFEACLGKYIAFCDGDDFWQSPNKLQRQADYLESHPECGLVYSSYDVNYITSGKVIKDFIKYRKRELPENAGMPDYLEKGWLSTGVVTCTVMIRHNLVKQIIEADTYLHQSGHFLMGDTQIWAEIAARARLHYIPESLATYSVMGESASRSKDIKKSLLFAISSSELYLYLCDKYKLPGHIRSFHEAQWCDYSLRYAYHTKNKELAEEVRNRKKTMTLKEWMRYQGARNSAFRYVYRVSASFVNVIKLKNNQ
jgi:glycosyltransferase involved in cell wall biosynthesis